jgi:tetratricopeptide (TPR) repeat protein
MIVIGRARRDLDQSKDALGLAQETLEMSRKAGNNLVSIQAYELMGTLQLDLERYPDALESFRQALGLSRDAPQFLGYELTHCADATWRLGNYEEADNLLKEAQGQKVFRVNEVDRIEAQMLLSQERFESASRAAQLLLDRKPPPDDDTIFEAELVQCRAKLALNAKASAQRSCDDALRIARKESDSQMLAKVNLALADFRLRFGDLKELSLLAEAARSYFASTGKRESEWQSSLRLMRISGKLGNSADAGEKRKNILDILSEVQHNWGTPAYKGYIDRPDIRDLMSELKAPR